jgi:type I restriction enzyme S subunit
MSDFVRGTTRQRISRKNLGTLTLQVPDVDAQMAIASVVDRIEAQRGRALQRVEAGRVAVEHARHAVLAAACSGRLTDDWREANPDVNADALQSRLIEGGPPRRGGRADATEARGLTSEAQLELRPPAWGLVRLGDILNVGTGATPLRKNRAYYEDGTIPWVTSGGVNAGTVTKPTELITPRALAETNVKLFPPGTLLVAMYGEGQTRGRVAELAIEAGTNQALAAVLFSQETMPLQPFVRLFFEDSYRRVRALSIGGVQPNLNLGMIKDTLLPLPALEEQAEIVRRAIAMMGATDRLVGQIDRSVGALERVTKASLARAFRGELKPTEAP